MSHGVRRKISIVSPVLNEEGSIPIFYERLSKALEPLRDRYEFELIFTNNRSTDRTLEVIREIRARDPRVQFVTFSRNFGYQPSVLAGLTYATGDGFLVIDVDCEDPPEMIPQLLEEWEKGYDVVYGERVQRTEAIGVQIMRLIFYRLNRILADSEIILDMAEFALVSRRVRDLMLANKSTFPFLRTEIGYVGFRRKGIRYRRQPRIKGRTHYNFIGMAKFATGGILSSSTFTLRLAAYILPVAFVWNLAVIGLLAFREQPRLFQATVLLDLLYAVFCLASLSLYTARIYKDGVARPVFIVDWEQSGLNAMPADPGPGWAPERRSGV